MLNDHNFRRKHTTMDRAEPHVKTNSSQSDIDASEASAAKAASRIINRTGNFLKEHRNKGVALLASGALTLSLAACGTSARSEGPTPTETATELPEPTVAGTYIEAEPTEAPTSDGSLESLRVPMDGDFGKEYLPLNSDEILVPTVPLEQLRAMSWEDFAHQKVEDRIHYQIVKAEEGKAGRQKLYFEVDENVAPDLIVSKWEEANKYAFFEDDPNECAKLAIADKMYTYDNYTGGIEASAASTAEKWKGLCETKGSAPAWVRAAGINFSTEQVIREEKYETPATPPQIVWTLTYDVYMEGELSGTETLEAVELTVQLPDGRTVVAFAQGYGA